MKQAEHKPHLFWPRVVMQKLLKRRAGKSEYCVDSENEETDSEPDSETEEFEANAGEGAPADSSDGLPRLRRRNSETFRAQYINTKEIRVCVGTWNVAGIVPPDDLDIDEWIDMNEPADVYVLGLQEIVPLHAGKLFSSEDNRSVSKWEHIIRETLNRIRPKISKIKSYSDPPSPSKFEPSDDVPNIEEEMSSESGSDIGEEVHPLDEETTSVDDLKDGPVAGGESGTPFPEFRSKLKTHLPVIDELQRQYSSPKKLSRLHHFRVDGSEESGGEGEGGEAPNANNICKLNRILSSTERIGLSWPEPPLDLLNEHAMDRATSFKSVNSFSGIKSFRTYPSFKATANPEPLDLSSLADLDLESLMKRKRRPPYVRLVSKKMVGIYLTVWARRSLRKHIQNIRISKVGVGVMGYIGNKGSVSVSLNIYQTLFCFVCTHLSAGEKEADELKRNNDVSEIHRRTIFHRVSAVDLPRNIRNHERIIWFGDLNYRINLPYEKTHELISRKEWSTLLEKDQLVREFRKGRAFDGWAEGTLNFPPTYKYEINSQKYIGEVPRTARRNPAWCDRILSYGNGIRLQSYRRAELKFSDHRPVTGTFMIEVEVFSSRKLQRALTFTDAEIENERVVMDG